jgi:citrate synthase
MWISTQASCNAPLIPVNMFIGVFALARTVGWIAQLNEMIGDPEY